jgi:rhodanese-related sulfurtransferase
MNLKKILFSVFLLCVFGYAGFAQENPSVQSIKAETLAEVEMDGKSVILDVRTPEEFKESYVQGAVHANVDGENFAELIQTLIPEKSTKVYVYCKSGKRSERAAAILSNLGYTNIVNVQGGITAIPSKMIVKP